jgi:hypothetical protein
MLPNTAPLPLGVSSLLIVPTPCPSVIEALVALVRLTKKVSFPSRKVSPFTITGTDIEVIPGAKVKTPELLT